MYCAPQTLKPGYGPEPSCKMKSFIGSDIAQFGKPCNGASLATFHDEVTMMWNNPVINL